MIKEAVLSITMLEYMSETCSETNLNIRVETTLSELSRYGDIKAFH